ncbi:MAG TPA: glycosyltransferase family 2 protein [Aurantimonas sp.]
MHLSIVTTLFRSAPYLDEFYRRASTAARQSTEDYEIVFVNDGSPDDSLEMAVGFAQSDPHVVVVDLSRNFGHHRAMMTGLAHARGKRIFLIDCDLEEDPAWIARFSEQLDRHQCDVVYGVQEMRKGGLFERWTGEGFYRIFNMLTGLSLPKNIIVARLMTRRYVDALLLHHEREIFLAGLWHITGFDQCGINVVKKDKGNSTYSIRHKLSLLVNSITSFSNKPLYTIFYVGVLISLFATIYTIYIVALKIINDTPLDGWTSVMASIWLIGGFMISFMGVIGIYLAKIFSESKRRPFTIVRNIYRNDR